MEQPGYTKPEAQRGLGSQLLIAFTFGSSASLMFSFWRRKWPLIYEARKSRKLDLPPSSNSLLGWIPQLIRVGDLDVLRFAGLDAYVYLSFFRLAIEISSKLSLVSVFFIAPLRWYYSGQFDDGNEDTAGSSKKKGPNMFGDYIWVYSASTYIFTIICLWTMRQYNYKIVSVRQAYLGHQSSITDRTLRISGIPNKSRSEDASKKYVTTSFKVEPESVMLCRKWEKLDQLMEKRENVLKKLEDVWADYVGPDNEVFKLNPNELQSAQASGNDSSPMRTSTPRYFDDESVEARYAREYGNRASNMDEMSSNNSNNNNNNNNNSIDELSETEAEFGASAAAPPNIWNLDLGSDLAIMCAKVFPNRVRPIGRLKFFGLAGDKVDLSDYYGRKLASIDREIVVERELAGTQPATNMAFVTMKTVAHCQLAAQCIFSPRPHTMVNSLAPAPNDIIWKNVYSHSKRRSIYNYVISSVVLITNVTLVYPLTYLARLLDLDYISKHLPKLGEWSSQRKWMAASVTDVLPTYLVSSFNLFIPYFFAWLTVKQGMVSKSDVQSSTISKNFFYVFVNLFLVFTSESTFSSFSVDKLAKDFAHWLIRLSSFYTNSIVLQGIGSTPVKLSQTGMLAQFSKHLTKCKSAREHYNSYKPQRLNYGLVLPMPMSFFIVTITYSILRRRILLFGLIYFAFNYSVYKYQLSYAVVYSHHSNAQLWSVIIRRMYLGIAVFHLAMAGVLVLQSEYTFAALIAPLSLASGGFWYDFERFTQPLLEVVAIEALRQRDIDSNRLGTYDLQDGASSFEEGDQALPTSLGDLTDGTILANHGGESVSGSTTLPSILWNSSSARDVDDANQTLDEMHEESQEYVNKNLVTPLDGPCVAANAFEFTVANPTGFARRRIPQADWF